MNRLLQITNVWTAENNSMFWVGASSGDPKRSISGVRFMGTLIEYMYICLCAVHLEQWNR
jgi:hypothetical protein